MSGLVVDASVAVKWYLTEPLHEEADAFFAAGKGVAGGLKAPALLLLEVASALWKRTRRGQLQPEDAVHMLDELSQSSLRYYEDAALARAAMRVALEEGTSVYDGTYVALAEAVDGKLVTADRALMARRWSARRAGRVVWLGAWQAALPGAPRMP